MRSSDDYCLAKYEGCVSNAVAGPYDSSPHLVEKHARLPKDGWYFDTILSTEQVAARARIAARVAGLLFGRDVKLQNSLRPIELLRHWT